VVVGYLRVLGCDQPGQGLLVAGRPHRGQHGGDGVDQFCEQLRRSPRRSARMIVSQA
jgi:hypothetical protein